MSGQRRRGKCPGCGRGNQEIYHHGRCGRCRARALKGQPLTGELPRRDAYRGACADFNGAGSPPAESCPYPPWSEERIAALAERAAAGQAMNHELDYRPVED